MAEAKEVSETKQELSLVCQFCIVYFNPGDDVVLSCHLEPAISAASMEIKWWNKTDLVCHYEDGRVAVNRDFEGRVSLSLEDLHNRNVHNRNVPSPAEDFRLVVPTRILSAHLGSNIILPVHLSPETSAWTSDGLDGGTTLIYHYNKGQEITDSDYEKRVSLSIQELERGNLALTLRNVQESDSGCKVFHNGCLKSVFLNLQVNVEVIRHWRQTHKNRREGIFFQCPEKRFIIYE